LQDLLAWYPGLLARREINILQGCGTVKCLSTFAGPLHDLALVSPRVESVCRSECYRAPSWSWVSIKGSFIMTCLSEYNSTILIDGFFIDATLGGANPYGDVKSGAQITIQGYLTTAKLRLEGNSDDNDPDKPLFPRDCGLRAPDDVAIVGASLARVAGNAGIPQRGSRNPGRLPKEMSLRRKW
jgi:hypothetical protein